MRYCTKCGTEIPNDAVYCPKCGAKAEGPTLGGSSSGEGYGSSELSSPGYYDTPVQSSSGRGALATVAYLFTVVSIFVGFFFLVPLLWLIPMANIVNRYRMGGPDLSTGMKVSILVFSSPVAGILLLCDGHKK